MDFKTNKTDQLIWQASIVLLALWGICQLLLAFDRSPSSDDALFLSVPKNWLNGYGWATSYSEKIPFNPDFTGPTTLLIPAALLIKLFGNQLWIAGVTGATINLILLSLCLLQIRSYWKNSSIAAFCLMCGCIISKPEDFASLVGYYSGSLLFLLATLVAFNYRYTQSKRAITIGLLAALGLHIKWLLAPAFILLILFFLLQKKISAINIGKLLALILLPVIILHGSWRVYRHYSLSSYGDAYIAAHKSYGDNFFRYHGSGIGQWLEAKDKLLYLTRNANKNLYFVEGSLVEYGIKNPFLGAAPADENHIVGWLLIAGLIGSIALIILKIIRKKSTDPHWVILVFLVTLLVYLTWFTVFSMAMSSGHFYFQNQWLLWIFLLAASQSTYLSSKTARVFFPSLLALLAATKSDDISQIFLLDRTNIAKTSTMQQAAKYIQKTHFSAPLAGCGYSGYPRHIEYLLPTSQNFLDCLDAIEDHVELSDGHYRWASPLTFNLVFSLQSLATNTASAMLLTQCKRQALYRNDEVFIIPCYFEDLQKLDLDLLIPEIEKTHNWYKTRIKL